MLSQFVLETVYSPCGPPPLRYADEQRSEFARVQRPPQGLGGFNPGRQGRTQDDGAGGLRAEGPPPPSGRSSMFASTAPRTVEHVRAR